VLNRIKASQRD